LKFTRLRPTRSGPSWEKKQKHCDPSNPEDADKGDQWDHTIIDVKSRFVVSVVVGKRDTETLKEVVSDFADRTGGVPPDLTTTDDCSTYPQVLMEQYGETVVPPPTGKPGRPRQPFKQWPKGPVYATVNKTYRKGKVAAVARKLVYGTEADLARALESSPASEKVNTAFIERQNGTDRNFNPRKARKTYEFSKELLFHLAVTWWVYFCCNFHQLHRSLRERLPDGTYLQRTPAMAIGLTERPLSMADILTTQVLRPAPKKPTLDDFRSPRRGRAP